MIPFRKIPDKEIAEMAASNQNPGLIVCVNFKFPKIDRIFSIWARICSHTLHHITRIKPTTFGVLRDYCFNDYMLQELLATKILSHSGSMGIESIDYYDAEEMSFDTLKLLFRLANVLTTSNFPAEYVTSAEGAITTPCYFGPVTVPQLLAERGHVYNGAFVADVTATVLGITGKLTIIEPSMAFMKAAIERRLVATDCDFTAEVGETSISVNHTRTFGRKSSNSFSAEELDNVLREVLPFDRDFFNVWNGKVKSDDNPLKEINEAILKSCERQPATVIPDGAKVALQEIQTLFIEGIESATKDILDSAHVQLIAMQKSDLQRRVQEPLRAAVQRLEEIREAFNLSCLDGLIHCGITELTGAREKRFFARKFQLFMKQYVEGLIANDPQRPKFPWDEIINLWERSDLALANEKTADWKVGLEQHYKVTHPEDAGLLLPDGGEYKFGEGLAHLYTEIPKIAEDGPYPVSKAEYDRLKASEPLQSAFVPLNIYGDGNGSYKKFPDINSLDSDTLRNVLDKMVSNPIAQAVNEGLVSPSKIAETVAHLGYQTDMDASIFSADGSKGVIAGVLDDSTLPVDADGNRAFILSDGVVPRRPTANCNHIQIRTQNDRTFELPLSVKTEVKRVYDVLVKDLDTLTKTLANLESREAKETNETEQRILGKLRTQPYERVVFCLSALRDAHGLKCFDSLIAYANDALSGDNTGMLMDRMLGFFIDIFVNKIGPNYYPCTNQLNNAALARLDPVAIMESFHQQALICSK